jgi:DNA helicase-2/ATP-dependent DNA helicase PcrA
MKLNASQDQAIKHLDGPLLIIAGAGTGKTTVITERIKHLIQNHKIDPYHIFAATFTEKAAEEMNSRLDMVMPLGYQPPWVGTFHGLCERLLRQEGLEIGINPNFKVINQTDQWIFLRQHLHSLQLSYYKPLGNPTRFLSALIKFFSRLADEAVNETAFKNLANKKQKNASNFEEKTEAVRLIELAKVYQQYRQLKNDEAVIDFGDLITYCLQLFQTRPNILRKYQKQFSHLIVDEFQDTNAAQFELIKLLAPPADKPNLVVVGDDDQAIYKFRGASISNILEFKNKYPQTREVVLTQNYRSHQAILDAAYQTIVNNNPDRLESTLHIDKKLKAITNQVGEIKAYAFSDSEQEINWTVKKIVDLVTKKNLMYKDIAILARANSHLETYAYALKVAGIPYQLVANHGLFDQAEILILITFLKVIVDPDDSMQLFQLSQTSVFNLDPATMLTALNQAKKSSISLFEHLSGSTDKSVLSFCKTITSFQQKSTSESVSQLLFNFLESTNLVKKLIEEESIENQLAIKNLNLFFNQLKRFERASDDKTVIGFLNTLELWFEAGENPGQAQIEDIDTVSIMTVHAAKGLEFEAVFVGSLVAGRFPSNRRKDPITVPDELIKELLPSGNEHLQEERRLFYVALTRAKQYLYLTHAVDVGGVRKRHVSGFVEETNIPIETLTDDQTYQPAVTTHKNSAPTYLNQGKYDIKSVSFSQLDTFDVCPLKYKYRYLLHIPAKPHHSLSFGRTIHQTLFEFHTLLQQKKTIQLNELLEIYKNNFIEEGYLDPKHKTDRFQAGLNAITHYYQHYAKLFGTPVLLEQPFSLKLTSAILNGKIDRIDLQSDKTYHIIDYKTGTHKDQKYADKDEQLTIYALAAREVFKLPVTHLSFYYMETSVENPKPEHVSTTRTNAQLEKAKIKLEKRIQTLQQSPFPAKPDPVTCGYCEYRLLCPFASKKAA